MHRKPFLDRFLPEYALGALPGPRTRAVIGWSSRQTAAPGRQWAATFGLPYLALEDGFLRSVGLGEAGATSLSITVDDLGVHYDAARPSRLEELVRTAPDWCDEAMSARTQALIARIVDAGLAKTNTGAPLDPSILGPGRRVLIVDQTEGDKAIAGGLAGPDSFTAMLAAARAAHPDAQLILKRHPAVTAGHKRGCIPDAELEGLTVVGDIRTADLLDHVHTVYVVTSGLGFEALLRGLPVHCFGAPFYAGWGLTQDAFAIARRGIPRTLQQVAAAALIRYSRYVDPVTGLGCEAEAAVERLVSMRDRARRLGGFWAGTGFAIAKQQAVRRLLNAPDADVRYYDTAAAAAAAAEARAGRLMVWAGKESPGFTACAAAFRGPVIRMEDGFIRSRGLGSNFVEALSVALDDQGIYYDASGPSRLETLIEAGGADPGLLARAAALRTRIVETGLSKYNLTGSPPPVWPTERRKILIVGQVEDDRSILLGCGDIRTNAGLVRAVRAGHPDAFLIYRDHPDVRAGNRTGCLDSAAAALVDVRADDLDILACIEACDAVATLTSLTGFEALLRGKRVMCWGRPFYAGWGLTEDHLPIPRRTRRASLDDLTAAALIRYPLYITPEGWPCEAEDLVNRLAQEASARPSLKGRARRWPRGLAASLDRRPPPAY
ncbi:capsular polysaccharide biosynthesis protein [Rhizobium sp. CRIBSB]|nr:capsular polysaccharide biosynthesis protein [Rhizobium sp. CRIBSB]